MHARLIVVVIVFLSNTLPASDQLTFSTDTIRLYDRYAEPRSDNLTIRNKKTIDTVAIDSICFNWRLNEEVQDYGMGAVFTITGALDMFVAYDYSESKKNSDTAFYFLFKNSKYKIAIPPVRSITLDDFMLGPCVRCLASQLRKIPTDGFCIEAVFVNNYKGRDTVYFTGPAGAMIFSGIEQSYSKHPEHSEPASSKNGLFLLSGRKVPVPNASYHQGWLPLHIYYTDNKRLPIKVK